MSTKKCSGCGRETNLLVALGGVLLCRDSCYPDISAEVEQLRSENKAVNVLMLARSRYRRLHKIGD